MAKLTLIVNNGRRTTVEADPETPLLYVLPHLPPLGAAEASCTPVPAALANAIFDATGVRLRSVPLTPAKLKAALRSA